MKLREERQRKEGMQHPPILSSGLVVDPRDPKDKRKEGTSEMSMFNLCNTRPHARHREAEGRAEESTFMETRLWSRQIPPQAVPRCKSER